MTFHGGHFLAPIHVELSDLFLDGHSGEEILDTPFDGKRLVFVRWDGNCNGLQSDGRGKQQAEKFIHTTSI